MTFNVHANVTADGVVITEGLRVFTNEMRTGEVVSDQTGSRCCHDSEHTSAQVRVNGGWFTDHDAGRKATGECGMCRHNHWFGVRYDGSTRVSTFDGERLATRFEGRKA